MKKIAMLLVFNAMIGTITLSAQDVNKTKNDPPKTCNKVSAEAGILSGSRETCTTKNADGTTTKETTTCYGVNVGAPKGNVSFEHCTTTSTTSPAKKDAKEKANSSSSSVSAPKTTGKK